MPNLSATTAQLTCPDCAQNFQTDVWLIVDIAERPDLVEAIEETLLHDISYLTSQRTCRQ